ncbi:MAG TPA: zinc-binding dehydrogenase, partial [Amycolatopsis sp.]|nr:zinc-binding dehydrogenase [Amycolatopsis sp.]
AAGQTVLIHGAGGGVGAVAVQLARDAGARVIGTGRGRHAEAADTAGVHEFVDLDRRWFAGSADLVFDTVGGDVLARSAAVVRPGGTLVSISAPPAALPGAGRAVYFIVEPDRAQLAELADRVRSGRLRPFVGATFPLPDTREAFLAKQNGVPGKVVLEHD